MQLLKVLVATAATVLVAAGCASKEEPATNAVASAKAALAEVRDDAAKFAPDELRAAESTLASLEDELAKEEYEAVLDGAPKLSQEVATLRETVVAKQTQTAAAMHEWERLSAEVPQMIETIQNRIDSLSASRLPKEVTKQAFETAKTSLESMKSTWAEAGAAFTAGNPGEAADKGRSVETQGKEVSAQLDMSPV